MICILMLCDELSDDVLRWVILILLDAVIEAEHEGRVYILHSSRHATTRRRHINDEQLPLAIMNRICFGFYILRR